MYEKVMIFCYILVMLNSAIKFTVGADSSESNKFLNKAGITTVAATKHVWQPITQPHYWLPTPTTLAAAATGATESLHRSYTENKLLQKFKGNTGNHAKQPVTAKLTTASHLPNPIESSMTLETYFYPLNKQNNDNDYYRTNTTTDTKEREKHQFNSYRRQLMSLKQNTAQSQYPPSQISKNAVHRQHVYPNLPPLHENSSVLAHFSNSNLLPDVAAKQQEVTNPTSSSLSAWHYTAHAKPNAATNTTNNMENILPTTLNSLLTDDNLIDDTEKHHLQQHLYISATNYDINSLKKHDEKTVQAAKTSTADRRDISGEKLLGKLANNEEFDDRIKHKNSSSNNNNDGKLSGPNAILNEDATYPGIDPKIFSSMVPELLTATSTALSAATVAALKKLQSFDMKNIFSAATSLLTFLQDANETENETSSDELESTAANGTEIIPQLRSLSPKNEILSFEATSTTKPTFSSSAAPSSKSSTSISSGRKLKKKVKKKLQQFLLPLVLAYKLKFLALIPLLAGGLIMLVGSTGMAGFFFALFTAVMSLKTDHGNAILVKKYE